MLIFCSAAYWDSGVLPISIVYNTIPKDHQSAPMPTKDKTHFISTPNAPRNKSHPASDMLLNIPNINMMPAEIALLNVALWSHVRSPLYRGTKLVEKEQGI